MIELNRYQTPVEDLVYNIVDKSSQTITPIPFAAAPQEVQDEFWEYMNTIPFIQWLVSKDRPLIGDLPKDDRGRAIWRIEQPPIITDVDWFRQTAIHYQKTGRFTDLRPNMNPASEYCKWVTEEVRRIREGYLRPDGAYITGEMYWYLNYSPILLTKDNGDGRTGYRDVDFPDFWEGILWRYTGWEKARSLGQHFAEIAKRGCSKSYSIASAMSRIFVVGEHPPVKNRKSSERGIVMGYQKEFLVKDGTLNKFEDMIDFLSINTEFPRKRLKSSLGDMNWTMGYIDLNTGAKRGTGNEVLGVAVKDDPDKGRGKRAQLICIEEYGKFPNVASVYNIAQPSVRNGDITFGLIVLVGTGGEEGNDFSGALDMMYHPSGSHLLSFENVWDRTAQSRGNSIFFFPAYVNREGCYNKDGISDVTKALYALCYERYIAKYDNPDPMIVTRTKAENPITIQDAIMRRDGTVFPVAQITQRLQEIDLNPVFFDNIQYGTLVQQSNGIVSFIPTGNKPIHKFPHKDNKVTGAVEISVMPEKTREGKVFSDRYLASLDPVDDDESGTSSLVSCFVLDSWTDNIVCEWTGRFMSADQNNEMVRLICLFYNAVLLYENNKKSTFAYFRRMNCTYLMAETPEFLKSKESLGKETFGNKLYGVNATAGINKYARELIRDWLLQPVQIHEKTPDGQEVESTVLKVSTIWNRAFLEELRSWNPDGNFDRVSSFGMLMLLREDRMIKYGGDLSGAKRHSTPTLADDPFFTRNYRHVEKRFKSQ